MDFVSVYQSRLGSTGQVFCRGLDTKWADTEWGHTIHGCSANEHARMFSWRRLFGLWDILPETYSTLSVPELLMNISF